MSTRWTCDNRPKGRTAQLRKRKGDPYLPDQTTWLKIRNTGYSQWIGCEKLFERERASDPDWHHGNAVLC